VGLLLNCKSRVVARILFRNFDSSGYIDETRGRLISAFLEVGVQGTVLEFIMVLPLYRVSAETALAALHEIFSC